MKELVAQAISSTLSPPDWPSRLSSLEVVHTKRVQDTTRENIKTDSVYATRVTGRVVRVYTTGNNLYESISASVCDDSFATVSPCKERINCVWCRQPIKADFIPSVITACTVTTEAVVFEGYDPACCIGCAQSNLNQEKSLRPHDLSLKTASDYLRRFSRETGLLAEESSIVPSPDWRLHKSNGGSLDDTAFYGSNSLYIRQPGVIVVPVKTTYISSTQ